MQEGAIEPGMRVMLLDDVATTGDSLLERAGDGCSTWTTRLHPDKTADEIVAAITELPSFKRMQVSHRPWHN